MNTNALIIEKIEELSIVVASQDSSEAKESLGSGQTFTSASFMKNLADQLNKPLILSSVGFLREFGINE